MVSVSFFKIVSVCGESKLFIKFLQSKHTITATLFSHTKEAPLWQFWFLPEVGCLPVSRLHWVFSLEGCLKPGVDYTLLRSGRMIHCVWLVLLGKRTFWASEQGHYCGNAAHLWSTLTADYTHSSLLFCLSRFITNSSCTFVTQETQKRFSFFFLNLPPTYSLKSSCVIILEMDALYTYSHIHTHNSTFPSRLVTEP